jgi:hypothetical protein
LSIIQGGGGKTPKVWRRDRNKRGGEKQNDRQKKIF